MKPEEFIMIHAAVPYDPVKAHDYYLRNRKLKGRRPGAKVPPKKLTGDLANEVTDTVVRPEFRGKFIPKGTPKSAVITTERQLQVEARVKELKGKLTILNAILKQLVGKAQGTSAPATKKTSSTKSADSKTPAADRKPLTSAEKADAAKKQKIRYQKQHPDAGKNTKENKAKIAEVRAKIQQVQSELKAAVASAKDKSKNVSAGH